MLPFLFKRAMILVAVCLAAAGMIAFCAGVFTDASDDSVKLRIGYTAEENLITSLAVAYVQDMESVRSICSLEPVTEQEGKQLLEDGELAALIVLPEDVINEILSGSNTPAVLYLPEDSASLQEGGLRAVGEMLFEELASAGIGMLGTAQAEIYASSAIVRELVAEYGTTGGMTDGDFLQTMYNDINRFNLGAVTGREQLFLTRDLSLTGNDTYAVYYGSALMTIYVMLAGLFFGDFCRRSSLWQTMAYRRIGVSYAAQLGARCQAGSALMLVVILLPLSLLFIPQVGNLLTVRITLPAVIILLLITVFMAEYYMMVYQMVERRESALVVIGVSALLQAYLTGCLIPSVLLPDAVAAAGRLLPAAMVKKGFTMLFTGETREFYHVAWGLWMWGFLLFVVTVCMMYLGGGNSRTTDGGRASARIRVPSLGMVMFRRLLHKKSIWVCMGLVVVLSVVIVRTEEKSGTQVRAAVYDEAGHYRELLADYGGLVQFELYGSEEEVQEAVWQGNAECGYILPGTLAADMTARRADWEITVYQAPDAVMVPVVNEILFERIFRKVSLAWYTDYIAQDSVFRELGVDSAILKKKAEDCFDRELLGGTTFRFEIRRLAAGRAGDESMEYIEYNKDRTTYPVVTVAVLTVLLCALQGMAQAAADIREKNFYKRNRVAMSALTVIMPVILGLLCFFCMMVIL